MILTLKGRKLLAETPAGKKRTFDFPAAAVSVGGVRIEARTPAGPPRRLPGGGWRAVFADGPCRFTVTVTPGGPEWFFKQVKIAAARELPTPDYVEVDLQKTRAPGLRRRGYMSSLGKDAGNNAEEGSGGLVPGCGYPLVGDDLFTGLEHPAAFNTVLWTKGATAAWQLRHFPVWEKGRIESVRAVIGLSGAPRASFFDYLDTVRLPVSSAPLISFCTFWSDPSLGHFEYRVDRDNYESLLEAFLKLDLRPDVYTLDAGWQDRRSFFRAKRAYGGEKALKSFAAKLRASGSDLSLWVSTNGPVGMDMDFLRSKGIAVGGGVSCHYSGPGYAVMMDPGLIRALTRRFRELASPEYGVRHFKVDWDNECAASPEFASLYPTRDHVREASIDMMARLNAAERRVNPKVLTRNGRWPSPWYLMLTSHVSLPDGGDCEYASFPALSQRDSAANHRDLLYWCVHVRDGSFFPLDVYDNHEFGHSLRNPFQETPGVWSNACVWAVMRGTSYHQFTLMPESLEAWQAEILRRCMTLLRKHASRIITGRSRMIGGSPGRGEIYGFLHPGPEGKVLLALRNSSPLPQTCRLPDFASCYQQYYPDCRRFRAGEKVTFGPHEVKILDGAAAWEEPGLPSPCQLLPAGEDRYECFLPASRKPGVRKIHQVPALELIRSEAREEEGRLTLCFGLRVPWRMRGFRTLFRITGKNRELLKAGLRTSRFAGCGASSYALPVTEIPWGRPGSGEAKNPDASSPRDARYFAADLPQGGEVFCSLELSGAPVSPGDVELWVSGYEAPARSPEAESVRFGRALYLPLPHPEGFPVNMRLW